MSRYFRRAGVRSLAIAGLLMAAACGALARPIPIKVRAIDKVSGSPIAGAHVIVFAQAVEGSFGGGGRHWNLFIEEGVTDEGGEVLLAPGFFLAPPALVASLRGPDLYIYKPGYQLAARGGRVMSATAHDIDAWGQGLPAIELVPAANERESIAALGHAIYQAERGYIGVETCEWTRIPRFLLALSAQATQLKRAARSGAADPATAAELRAIQDPVEAITRSSRAAVCADRARGLFPAPAAEPVQPIRQMAPGPDGSHKSLAPPQ